MAFPLWPLYHYTVVSPQHRVLTIQAPIVLAHQGSLKDTQNMVYSLIVSAQAPLVARVHGFKSQAPNAAWVLPPLFRSLSLKVRVWAVLLQRAGPLWHVFSPCCACGLLTFLCMNRGLDKALLWQNFQLPFHFRPWTGHPLAVVREPEISHMPSLLWTTRAKTINNGLSLPALLIFFCGS